MEERLARIWSDFVECRLAFVSEVSCVSFDRVDNPWPSQFVSWMRPFSAFSQFLACREQRLPFVLVEF